MLKRTIVVEELILRTFGGIAKGNNPGHPRFETERLIEPTKPITPVFLCVTYPIDFYRPHFILPLPGSKVSISSGFL
mgnify:CR=1 FL=1